MLTILYFFLQTNYKCIENVIWVLYAFEALSGIRINFSKTKLIPVNIIMEEATILTALVGCKISSFPLKYLGVPLSDGKLKLHDWHSIIDKVQ
jgi:hypothetical protein